MLHVTPEARLELHTMLQQALTNRPDTMADCGFRLVADSGAETTALGLALDSTRAGDQVIEHEGLTVLIIDGDASALVNGLVLDVIETPDGRGLTLRERREPPPTSS